MLRKELTVTKQEQVQLTSRAQEQQAQLEALQAKMAMTQDTLTQREAALTKRQEDLAASQARERELAEKLATLHTTSREVESRLAAVQARESTLGAGQDDLRRMISILEDRLKERDTQLVNSQQQLLQLPGALARTKELELAVSSRDQEVSTLRARVDELKQAQVDQQEQLRVARQSHGDLSQEMQDLQDVAEDYDTLKSTLREREEQLATVKDELGRLRSELSRNEESFSQDRSTWADRDQQTVMERQGLQWRLESLQKELAEAKASQQQLQAASRASEEPANGAGHLSDAQAPADDGYEVKVYQVNTELDFVVLSIDEMTRAKKGATLLLADQGEPVAAVELTELDDAGFAVAKITHTISPAKQLRKGDTLLATQLSTPVAR
jgi:chromosome segregation ATPase